MTRVSATADGAATQIMERYYERFAKGGFGLLITEGLYTDTAFSQGYLHQPGLSDDALALSWKPIVESVHSNGARIFAQVMHAGAISQGNRFRANAVGPSAIKPKGEQMAFYYGKDDYATPAEITDGQIADAIDAFGSAAARAVSVGFDGIEIHGANGYLLDQFLTDTTNKRKDRRGGGPRERMALIVAVVEAVRAKVGNECSGWRPYLARQSQRFRAQVARRESRLRKLCSEAWRMPVSTTCMSPNSKRGRPPSSTWAKLCFAGAALRSDDADYCQRQSARPSER